MDLAEAQKCHQKTKREILSILKKDKPVRNTSTSKDTDFRKTRVAGGEHQLAGELSPLNLAIL